MIEIDLGLQAHQIHRDHEHLVVVFRIAGRCDRGRAEIGNIESRFRRQVVERNDDLIAR